MAKPIYTLMDTDGLKDYIASNPEMFGLQTDADGEEIPDDVYDKVVDEIVERSTDGRLMKKIGECLEGYHAQHVLDYVYDCIDEFVYEEANNLLKKYL